MHGRILQPGRLILTRFGSSFASQYGRLRLLYGVEAYAAVGSHNRGCHPVHVWTARVMPADGLGLVCSSMAVGLVCRHVMCA